MKWISVEDRLPSRFEPGTDWPVTVIGWDEYSKKPILCYYSSAGDEWISNALGSFLAKGTIKYWAEIEPPKQ